MTLEQAKQELGDSIKANGDIDELSPYMNYYKGFTTITLDGDFGPDELEAMAIYMRSQHV